MSQPTRIPPRRKSSGDSQTLFSALILVIVFASLAGMYFYLEGQRKANEEVLNSIADKVRVIEDKLSITNEDSEQNMQTVLDQIKFIDTEVRKLWGHRKGYLDSIKKQENKTAANDRSIKQLGSKSTNLEDKIDSINNKIELAEDLQLKITMLTNELNKQKQILDDNGENLDAIDRYRIQNNQKVTEILTRLNNLSRELDDIQESLGIQAGATNG
mgnify:FL=1